MSLEAVDRYRRAAFLLRTAQKITDAPHPTPHQSPSATAPLEGWALRLCNAVVWNFAKAQICSRHHIEPPSWREVASVARRKENAKQKANPVKKIYSTICALSSLRRERRFPTNRRQAFVALAPFLIGGGRGKRRRFYAVVWNLAKAQICSRHRNYWAPPKVAPTSLYVFWLFWSQIYP